MRVSTFAFVAAILLTASCNEKKSEATISKAVPDLAGENLKGDITQVELDTYLIDSTGKTGPLDEKSIEKFDSSGYTTSYVDMNGKDSVKTKSNFEHNPNGFMTSMETVANTGEKKSAMTVDYDSSGKYTLAKSFDSTGKIDIYYKDITSNKWAQVTGAKGYHPDSTLKMTFTNDFDSIFYVGGDSKDSVGKTTYSSKIKLNDKRDIVKLDETTVTMDPKTKKDSTKNTVTTYTYETWDPLGNWIQQTSINEKGKPVKIVKRIITYKQ
ncbi:MAG: hypothetical protein M3139_01200 [Bacteroidota bacterium]|nr:hypothetical protein [Bacteroidota bacterium]